MRVDLKARPHKVSTFRNVYIYTFWLHVYFSITVQTVVMARRRETPTKKRKLVRKQVAYFKISKM